MPELRSMFLRERAQAAKCSLEKILGRNYDVSNPTFIPAKGRIMPFNRLAVEENLGKGVHAVIVATQHDKTPSSADGILRLVVPRKEDGDMRVEAHTCSSALVRNVEEDLAFEELSELSQPRTRFANWRLERKTKKVLETVAKIVPDSMRIEVSICMAGDGTNRKDHHTIRVHTGTTWDHQIDITVKHLDVFGPEIKYSDMKDADLAKQIAYALGAFVPIYDPPRKNRE
jgi:hypothetical protein